MSRWRCPTVWFPLSLLIVAGVGAGVLCLPGMLVRDARDAQFFFTREMWERAFDAISAVAGCGALSRDLEAGYSPAGRWTLAALGVGGALLWLLASAPIWRRLLHLDATSAPGAGRIVLAWLAVQVALGAALHLAAVAFCPTVHWTESAWLVATAFNSVGLSTATPDAGTAATIAVVGLISALGWPFWLVLISPRRAVRALGLRRLVLWPAGLVGFVVLVGGLLALLESPRGEVRVSPTDRSMAVQPAAQRVARGATQAAAAISAGVATEPLADGGLRDASLGLIALAAAIGSAGGSPVGGMSLLVVLMAIRGSPRAARHALAVAALVIVGAVGLLAIESLVAVRFQRPPTLAGALLDSVSLTCGANLSSGLVASITQRSLVSGLGVGVNLYQLGMVFAALLMLVGRVLPVWMLTPRDDAPPTDTPH